MTSLKKQIAHDAFLNEKWAVSITKYAEYLQDNPDSSSSWLNIAAAYYNLNQLDVALENIEYAIEVDPEWHLIYVYKAQIYMALNDKDAAKKALNIAKDILKRYAVI